MKTKAQKLEQDIKQYMLKNIEYHIDPLTGEANSTEIAEDAINALAGPNWEEWHEDDHPVWKIAVYVAGFFDRGITI